MQKLQKRRYLARDIKALRCQIRFSPESIRGAVAQIIARVIPMAIRTSSTRTATTMVGGSTRTMTSLTTGGIVIVGSRSPWHHSLHFSPALAGEFCFVSWPYQPPSILPISSTLTDKAIYLLLSRDLVSQSIIKNIFSVSTFLIDNRT